MCGGVGDPGRWRERLFVELGQVQHGLWSWWRTHAMDILRIWQVECQADTWTVLSLTLIQMQHAVRINISWNSGVFIFKNTAMNWKQRNYILTFIVYWDFIIQWKSQSSNFHTCDLHNMTLELPGIKQCIVTSSMSHQGFPVYWIFTLNESLLSVILKVLTRSSA